MKLGKRLTKLDSMVLNGYQHIWDCCCDHGLLGMCLLERNAAENIHFVDIVPDLIDKLNFELTAKYPSFAKGNSQWQTHCLDVANLPLNDRQDKHLIIIAGVGGDEVINLVDEIHSRFRHLDIDYLLCPVYHQYALRQQLRKLDLNLIDEALVKERKQFYELLLISSQTHKGNRISAAGELIWKAKNETELKVARQYLEKTLSHYQKSIRRRGDEAQEKVRAYEHCESLIEIIR